MNENVLNKLKLPIILIFILLAISFLSVVPVLNMILLGAMLAYGIRPIASKIQTKTKYQSISIVLAIVVVIIPIILVMAYMIIESIGLMSSFLNAGGFSLGTNSSEVPKLACEYAGYDSTLYWKNKCRNQPVIQSFA